MVFGVGANTLYKYKQFNSEEEMTNFTDEQKDSTYKAYNDWLDNKGK